MLLNFYPDHDNFWLGLLLRRSGGSGVFTLAGGVKRFGVALAARTLILAQLVSLCWLPVMWLGGDPVNGVEQRCCWRTSVALIWLLTNQHFACLFFL